MYIYIYTHINAHITFSTFIFRRASSIMTRWSAQRNGARNLGRENLHTILLLLLLIIMMIIIVTIIILIILIIHTTTSGCQIYGPQGVIFYS